MKNIFWKFFSTVFLFSFFLLAIFSLFFRNTPLFGLGSFVWIFPLAVLASVLQSLVLVPFVKQKIQQVRRTLQETQNELQKEVRALAVERAETFAIVASMTEGVLVVDEQERVVLVNVAAANIFDIEWKEAEANPLWEIVRHRGLVDLIRKALSEQALANTEVSIFVPEEKILHAQVSPIRMEKGQRRGVVCVFHDITPLKKLERLKTDFVANVSHELKTPLTSIKGFVETLQEGAIEDPPSAREFLDIIKQQSDKLERLIAELLTLAKLESKEPDFNFKPFDLVTLLKRIDLSFKEQLRLKQQSLELLLPPAPLTVIGDEEKLEQALSNLTENAIKFTSRGGKITVSVLEEPSQWRFSVSDTGIGIPEDHLGRIFERFYRVDKSRSRESGGTGLGLAIVKHIAQGHQGDVDVHSQVGKGSVFTILLPKRLS